VANTKVRLGNAPRRGVKNTGFIGDEILRGSQNVERLAPNVILKSQFCEAQFASRWGDFIHYEIG